MSLMPRLGGLLLLVSLPTACSVSLDDADANGSTTANSCQDDGECGASGRCQDSRCVASELGYDEILVEVNVPATSTSGAYGGTRLFRTLTGLASGGGPLDVEVPGLSTVTVALTPPPCVDDLGEDVARVAGECPAEAAPASGRADCRYDFAAVPLEVVLTPRARSYGIATVRYAAETACRDGDCGYGAVELAVPPGEYDVYLRVDPLLATIPAGLCDVIPELATVTVPDGADLAVEYPLAEPELLPVEVHWAHSSTYGALEGFTLDMLDNTTGKRLSTRVPLGVPVIEGDLEVYSAILEYALAPGNANVGNELVRLIPPQDMLAPMVVVERSSLGLLGGPAVLDQLTSLPRSVEVEGQLIAFKDVGGVEGPVQVSGTITFIATSVDGLAPGTLVALQAKVETGSVGDDLGVFRTDLLPGEYRVRVTPSESCPEFAPCPEGVFPCECPLGATELEGWSVAPSPDYQGGRTIELVSRTRLTGTVVTAAGMPMVGAPIQAVAVSALPTALAAALGEEAFVPRSAMTSSVSDGSFNLRLDAGDFDFAVRPDTSTGFPWLSRPRVPIELGDTNVDLGELAMPLPVAFTGKVKVPISPPIDGLDYAVLPNATLRVYRTLDTGPVVQIAETTADDAGEFELLLPEHL